jgi:hypothetical protein
MTRTYYDYLHTLVDIHAQNHLGLAGNYDALQDRVEWLSELLSEEEMGSALRVSKDIFNTQESLSSRRKAEIYDEVVNNWYTPEDVHECRANEIWEGGYAYDYA